MPFTNNVARTTGTSNTGSARGGAIYSYGDIPTITGSFNTNASISAGGSAEGGAVYMNGTVETLTANFENNFASGNNISRGGALFTINGENPQFTITGNFTNNYVISSRNSADGGAIYTEDRIKEMTSDLIGNYASGNLNARGGAIAATSSSSVSLTGVIQGNYASATQGYAKGGAIYAENNFSKIISTDISNNYAESNDSFAQGGALAFNGNGQGNIGNIEGPMTQNTALSNKSYAEGGAIYAINANIRNITGRFTNNKAQGSTNAKGGAISTYGEISSISLQGREGDLFSGNETRAVGTGSGHYAYGGAIHIGNSGKIGSIIGNLSNNTVFSNASAAYGGAIYSANTETTYTLLISGSLTSNIASGKTDALGGAIYTSSNVRLLADNANYNIVNNQITTTSGASYIYQAIYVANTSKTVTIEANNHGSWYITDSINGVRGYSTYLKSDETGVIKLYNQIYNSNVSMEDVKLKTSTEDPSALRYSFDKLTIVGDKAFWDMDFVYRASGEDLPIIDTIYAGEGSSGTLIISELNGLDTHYISKQDIYVPILEKGGNNNNLHLGLDNSVYTKYKQIIEADTYYDQVRDAYILTPESYTGEIGVRISDPDRDRELIGDRTNTEGIIIGKTTSYDSLAKVNQLATPKERYFIVDDAERTYNVIQTTGRTGKTGAMHLVGKSDQFGNRTIINYQGNYAGFTVPSGEYVTIDDVTMTGGSLITQTSSETGGTLMNNAGTVSITNVGFYNSSSDITRTGKDVGGTIANTGTISPKTNKTYGIELGYFESNSVTNTNANASGGAIYNAGTINGIEADFKLNTVNAAKTAAGGGIYNKQSITEVIGQFHENYIVSTTENALGGAIFNSGTINSLENGSNGMFKNSAQGAKYAHGGAIYNMGTITSIISDFNNNTTLDASEQSYGGAIFNRGTIQSMTGALSLNHATGNGASYGGAIYADTGSNINSFTGKITNNYAQGTDLAAGGAIYVNAGGTITTISSNKIEDNYVTASNDDAKGGAIATAGTITSLTSTFNINKAESTNKGAYGGAIYIDDTGSIGLTASFTNNNTYSTNDNTYGGAIYNAGTLTLAEGGEFKYNYAEAKNIAQGGALHNAGSTNKIENTLFKQNYAISTDSAYGGAIANTGTGSINTLNATFENNYSRGLNAYGGAIYNTSNITSVNSIFTGNSAIGNNVYGGVLYNEGTITTFQSSNITNNTITSSGAFSAYGGAIYNTGTITTIQANIESNTATGATSDIYGGAIANIDGTIGMIEGNIKNNSATGKNGYGGAIYNTGTIGINGSIENNYVSAATGAVAGGAIYNTGTISQISGSIKNNYASGKTSAYGGAIYTTGDITFVSTGDVYEIANNYVELNGVKTYNGIYVDNADVTITFNSTNGGGYTISDDFVGSANYYVLMNSTDNSANYTLRNHINNATVTLNGGNYIFNYDTFAHQDTTLTVLSGNIKLQDAQNTNYQITQLTSDDTARYTIDLSATNQTSDKLVVGGGSSGIIHISDVGTDTTVAAQQTVIIPIIVKSSPDAQVSAKIVLDDSITHDNIFKTLADYANYTVTNRDFIGAIGIFVNDDTHDFSAAIDLDISNTSDSIVITSVTQDTLHMVNISNLSPRTYRFAEATTINQPVALGKTGEGIFNVVGFNNNADLSVINMNNLTAFDIEQITTLDISNLTIKNSTNAINVKNDAASVTLTNVKMSENDIALNVERGTATIINSTISGGTRQNKVDNAGILNVQNSTIGSNVKNDNIINITNSTLANLTNNQVANITGNVTITTATSANEINLDGDVVLSANISGNGAIKTDQLTSANLVNTKITNNSFDFVTGQLIFGVDTFKDAGVFTTGEGTIDLRANAISTYNIKKLASSADTVYKISVDISNPQNATIDKFALGSDSSGVITIHELAGATKDSIGYDYSKNLIILPNASAAKIAIDEDYRQAMETVYTVGTYLSGGTYKIYNDTFIGRKGIAVNETETGIIIGYTEKLKTLHETNISPLTPREYTFRTATTVQEDVDLGVTGQGVFNVFGANSDASASIISLGGSSRHSGFDLTNNTTLTAKNVTIKDGSVALHLASSGQVNLDNVIFTDNTTAIQVDTGIVNLKNVTVNASSSSGNPNDIVNAGTLSLNEGGSKLYADVTNNGTLTTNNTNLLTKLTNNGTAQLNGSTTISTLINNAANATVTTQGTTIIDDVTNIGDITTSGTNTFKNQTLKMVLLPLKVIQPSQNLKTEDQPQQLKQIL